MAPVQFRNQRLQLRKARAHAFAREVRLRRHSDGEESARELRRQRIGIRRIRGRHGAALRHVEILEGDERRIDRDVAFRELIEISRHRL